MTAILGTTSTNPLRTATPTITPAGSTTSRPPATLPVRRTYSTPLQAVRRRQEALERLAARAVMPRQQHPRPFTAPLQPVPVPASTDAQRVPLTNREIEVLRTWLLVDSKSDAAALLNISVGTVNTHLARIRTKYADANRPARTKASLVARAIQDGLATLDEL